MNLQKKLEKDYNEISRADRKQTDQDNISHQEFQDETRDILRQQLHDILINNCEEVEFSGVKEYRFAELDVVEEELLTLMLD